MAGFVWDERNPINPTDLYERSARLSMHPRPDGMLFSLNSHLRELKTGVTFDHTQASFSADLEQVVLMTNLLLLYLKEIANATDRKELP